MLRFQTHAISWIPEVLPEPDFHTIEELLRSSGTSAGAAELHGALCGLVCADPGGSADAWADQVLPRAGGPEVRSVLVELAEHARAVLEGADPSFAPLLPEDQTGLEFRSTALASWSQGFLYGLGLGGVGEADSWPADLAEIMADLSELSRATHEARDDSEEAEVAYAELYEFIRVSAQLAFEILARGRLPAGGGAPDQDPR